MYSFALGEPKLYVKMLIERKSVDAGHVSHLRTSPFWNHLGYCIMVPQNISGQFESIRLTVLLPCLILPYGRDGRQGME